MLVMVPAAPADQAFLFDLYTGTRPGRPRPGDASLLAQYEEREGYLRRRCPRPERLILVWQGEPAGAALICRRGPEIRLMDLAVLPRYQGRGIGTTLIRTLQTEAQGTGLRLSLQVERANRARSLYERLGFVKIAETPSHVSMVWAPRRRG